MVTAKVDLAFTLGPQSPLLADVRGPDSSMVEQLTFNQLVPGSSPGLATSNHPHASPPKSLAIKVHLLLKSCPRLALIPISLSGWIAQW